MLTMLIFIEKIRFWKQGSRLTPGPWAEIGDSPIEKYYFSTSPTPFFNNRTPVSCSYKMWSGSNGRLLN
jgi:hypothetical protein